MKIETIQSLLASVLSDDAIRIDEPMKNRTSFQVGGPADILVMPDTTQKFCEVIDLLQKEDVPYYIMGNGTNLLVGDKGYRGVIVNTRNMNKIERDGCEIIAEAGASYKDVAQFAQKNSLQGLEFASGIPGSIGGAAVMNAGAYDGETKNVLKWMDVLTEHNTVERLPVEACKMGYRHSIVQENPWYVLRVCFALEAGDSEAIQSKMDRLNQQRRDKQPLEYPSAGSTFRRPEGYYAGKLIEDAGFRGYRHGGAQVSEKHCGFVINADHATAQDIRELIAIIQNKIKEDVGVEMRTEVIAIGE